MKIGEERNEHGILRSVHRCPDCNNEFTVTPAAGSDWGGCLGEGCPSYDPDRDCEWMFEEDEPTQH